MKTIVVGFSKPNKFMPFAWLIMKAYDTPYAHVYIKFNSDTYERTLIYQASHSMVNFMSNAVFNYGNETIAEFEITISDLESKPLIQFMIDNSGISYGILNAVGLGISQLVKLIFNKEIKNIFGDGNKTWVCDEIAGSILQTFHNVKFSKSLDDLTPKDLYEYLETHEKRIN